MVGARGFEPPTLRSRIDYKQCPSLFLNGLRPRWYMAFYGVLGCSVRNLFAVLFPVCSQFLKLPFIIIYDNLGCR